MSRRSRGRIVNEDGQPTTTGTMDPGEFGIITAHGNSHHGTVVYKIKSDLLINMSDLSKGRCWTPCPNFDVRILPPGTKIEITVG